MKPNLTKKEKSARLADLARTWSKPKPADRLAAARKIKAMMRDGITLAEMMAATGYGKDHFYRSLKLLDAPPIVREAFAAGQISILTACALASQHPDGRCKTVLKKIARTNEKQALKILAA